MRKLSMWIGLTILMCAIVFTRDATAFAQEPGWAEKLSRAEGVLSVEIIPPERFRTIFQRKIPGGF